MVLHLIPLLLVSILTTTQPPLLPFLMHNMILEWKPKHLLAKEAILTSLSAEDYNTVSHEKYAYNIWNLLQQEFGGTFKIKRTVMC
jgi:hypothetical protein